jgi:GntR family transcriptional regulator
MSTIESTFQQLQERIAKVIMATPAGDRLPSEPKFAQQLGVSRSTLREAMRTFEGQGLIRRRQGLGTYVVGRIHVIESGLEVLESIETLSQKIGLSVSMGEVRINTIEAKDEIAAVFGVDAETPLMQVARVINAENRPVAYLIDILPDHLLSSIELQEGFTGSVLDLLIHRGEPPLNNSRTEIRASAAPTDVARALQIQRGDVLLVFVACLYDNNGKVVDYSTSYFLPGYFRFHVVRRLAGINPY